MNEPRIRPMTAKLRLVLLLLTLISAALSVWFKTPPSQWVSFESSPFKFVAAGVFAFTAYFLMFIPAWLPAFISIRRKKLFLFTSILCITIMLATIVGMLIVIWYGNPHALIYTVLFFALATAGVQLILLRVNIKND